MANDLATVKALLDTQLADTANTIWGSTEKENVLTWAIAGLDLERPRVVRETVTLVTDTEQYSLTACLSVARVDLLDEDSELMMQLPSGSWELWGDGQSLGTLYVNSVYCKTDWFLRVHGYSAFDLVTNLPPNRMIPMILATARAELLRRQITRRADFKNWSTLNQTSNSSVNELLQMLNEADAEANRLRRDQRIIQKPKPGRV